MVRKLTHVIGRGPASRTPSKTDARKVFKQFARGLKSTLSTSNSPAARKAGAER